jgi:hypothetical protein
VINPTASALERVGECTASHVLPAAHTTSGYAKRGQVIASFVRRVLGGMPRAEAAALVADPDWRTTCTLLDFTKLVGDLSMVRGEMAYALNVETDDVRELGTNLGRNYPPLEENEIGGTDDIEGMRIDDVPVVIDVKTGQPVTACCDNPQIKFFARVLQLRTGAQEVEGRIAYVSDDGHVEVDSHTFSAFDLDSFGDDLAEIVRRVASARTRHAAGEVLTVSSGSHCRYCPAMAACPRYTALARTMVGDVEDMTARLGVMTPEQQGVAYEKAKEIEKFLGVVLDGLKELARQNPIPLRSGKFYKETKSHSTHLNTPLALAMLREYGVTDVQIAALYKSTPTFPVKVVNGPKTLGAPKRKARLSA